jgi:hypothetical protein
LIRNSTSNWSLLCWAMLLAVVAEEIVDRHIQFWAGNWRYKIILVKIWHSWWYLTPLVISRRLG